MSGGFPLRIGRDDLGPDYRDLYPVENPETDVAADALNLLRWQAAGAALTAARAVLIAKWESSAWNKSVEFQAWNGRFDQANPSLSRVAPGNYTYTFAATYKDRNGNDVATTLHGARCTVLDHTGDEIELLESVRGVAWIESASPLIVRIRTPKYESGVFTGNPDRKFLLEVF